MHLIIFFENLYISKKYKDKIFDYFYLVTKDNLLIIGGHLYKDAISCAFYMKSIVGDWEHSNSPIIMLLYKTYIYNF